MPKKKWMKPKLIVLLKPRLPEAVLTECKTSSGGGPSTYEVCGYSAGCFTCVAEGS